MLWTADFSSKQDSIVSVFVIKPFFVTCSRKCDFQQEWIKMKIKSFHTGYSDLLIRIKGIKILSYQLRAENFRMVDIGINAWSSLFDNLQNNIILQDYLKSVWKTIKFKLIFNQLRNCSSQSEKSRQPM